MYYEDPRPGSHVLRQTREDVLSGADRESVRLLGAYLRFIKRMPEPIPSQLRERVDEKVFWYVCRQSEVQSRGEQTRSHATRVVRVGVALGVCMLGLCMGGSMLLQYDTAPTPEPSATSSAPYTAAEQWVLQDPALLQQLGLCEAAIAQAEEQYVQSGNMARYSVLTHAAAIAEREAVTCSPGATSVAVPAMTTGRQLFITVTARDLVGDAAPVLWSTPKGIIGN
ncbi:MAG TPA: hypothetical protein VLE73_01390 [Candidatus Saccharimonadales bacterium]|nr:hypothetical protein [Candidatus Saccharimonadales bacterium]